MIKYRLVCKNCDLLFDSWFASSREFEKLKKRNFLNCHNCDSKKVEKTLMAPKLINKDTKDIFVKKNKKISDISDKIRKYQKFIKKNFTYVGKNFAYEARSIHYKSKKSDKGIFGTASKSEVKELKEEGIHTEIIPWVEDKNN